MLVVAFSMFAHVRTCCEMGGSPDIIFQLLAMLPTFWTDALKEASASDRNVCICCVRMCSATWSIAAGLSSLHSYAHIHMLTP